MDKNKLTSFEAQLHLLSAEIENLKRFICESDDLRERYKDFLERPLSRHGMFSGGTCICSKSSEKVGTIFNETRFYAFDEESNPDRYNVEPDGAALYEQDKFKEAVNKEVLPLFETLAALEPERIRKEHIAWLKRCDHRFTLWRYLAWLIPEIRSEQFGMRKPISNPKALEAVKGLERIIGKKTAT